ncbi:MAG: hypothetical protein K9G49_09360 [Taibaiella sp.]|nr:hypothetical protein [Taibaiella sp.]
MKKLLLTTTMCAAVAVSANAQRLMGIATGNWSGTTSLALNPANLADNRARFVLDLAGLNFGIDNNLASVNLSKATGGTDGGLGGGGLLTFSNNNKFNIMMPVAEIRLPGAMYTIDHKNAVALTMRVRGFNQFNNFDKTLFQSLMDPATSAATGYNFSSSKFNWTAQMWSEINLSYGRVVYEKGKHFVKAGITLGRMNGIGFLSVNGTNLNAQFYGGDSLVANNTDIQFASSVLDSAGQLGSGLGDISLFGKGGGSGGGGFRADIGAVYEYRPDDFDATNHGSNKYRVRGSLAITDLGKIKYNNAVGLRATGNGTMSAGDLAQNILNYSSLQDYMNSRGFFLDTGKQSAKVGIPTAMVLGVDYYIKGHFYVNGTWIKNVANRGKFGNSYYGQLTITPRFDTKIFSFAMPLTYSAMTKGVKAGVGIRLGGLYFGSDDMLLFVSDKAYGVNFFVGGFVPINRRNKHRKSGDDNKIETAAPAAPAPTTK